MNQQGEPFGKDRLHTLLRSHRAGTADEIAGAIAGAIHEAVERWSATDDGPTDMSLVVVKLGVGQEFEYSADQNVMSLQMR